MKTYKLSITISEGGKELQKEIQLTAEDPKEEKKMLLERKEINHEDLISTVEDAIHEKPELIPCSQGI
jgi:hypothetical protein